MSIDNVPAVSHNPKLTILPSTDTFALKLSKTVGIYSYIHKKNFKLRNTTH
jgi:hypothetical protein